MSIGNIIAFVRLARTASKKMSSDELPYLPSKFKLPESLEQKAPYRSAKAKIQMDKMLSDAHHQQDSDYIRAFVDVFKGVVQVSNDPPPNGFFCMVPALCLNWMGASIQGKEMMHKKNITQDGYFTDDGFAVGLTFCLVVLDQMKQYER